MSEEDGITKMSLILEWEEIIVGTIDFRFVLNGWTPQSGADGLTGWNQQMATWAEMEKVGGCVTDVSSSHGPHTKMREYICVFVSK